jgi:biotin operon repressor
MAEKYKIDEMDVKIQEIKKAAQELQEIGGDIEAVKKNLVRLLASTKMLELNISDAKLVM